jgi:hypothetical protein
MILPFAHVIQQGIPSQRPVGAQKDQEGPLVARKFGGFECSRRTQSAGRALLDQE